MDVVTLSTTSYEIRYYHATSVSGTTYPKTTFTSVPFATYRVEQGTSATQIKITKEIRNPASATDTTAAIARSEFTTLTRSGTLPAFTWTLCDWTLTGQTPLAQEVRVWASDGSGGHTETITTSDSSSTVATQVYRAHTHFAWGDTPTTLTAGTTNPATSTFTYNTDSSDQGSYGFVSSTQTNGGSWQAYTYFPTTDPLQLGMIKQTFQPFLNAPSTVGTNASAGTVTTYTYAADAFGMLTRPTTIQTQVNGVTTSNTTITYTASTANSLDLVVAARTDQTNSTGSSLTSSTEYYQEDTYDSFFRSQVHSSTSPNGVKQAYVRQRGTLSGATFTPGATGAATRIGIINGSPTSSSGTTALSTYAGYAVSTVYLVPNKSTFDATYRDSYARVARTESYVWDGSAWQLLSAVDFVYNFNNQLTSRTSSNGDLYEAGYVGELKQWERDGAGNYVSYTYDAAGRVDTVTKQGFGGTADLITQYTYDGADQVTQQQTHAAGGTETITSSKTYDLAGRVSSETAPGASAVIYAYDPVNRQITVTTPDSSTRIQTSYMDGQLSSTTGTGVVNEYYTYGVETDGRRWGQVNLATASSSRWRKNWADWLGRADRSERPGFTGQANFVEQNTYSTTTGQLTKTTRTDTADTLYTYGVLGQPALSGLDINANGTLDLASTDRITGQEKWFAYENSAWWVAGRSFTYATSGSATETTLGSSRERLTGFTGTLRAETRATDAEGNTSTAVINVDRTARTTTKTTTAPGLSSPQVETAVNGLGSTTLTPDGLTYTTGYDALQRPVTATNIRAGVTRTVTTAYDPGTTRPLTVTDPAGNVTATYAYDTLGRKKSVTNALNKVTRFDYTDRGELAHQWGEAAAPAAYVYSTYGERTGLTTYRTDGSTWTGTTWPASPPFGDTTTWTFDGPSGLLVKKTDAATNYVEYDYNPRGQVLHRYWQRLAPDVPGNVRVTATYAYDSLTAEPLSTTYNDGTPSVSTTYTRTGQPLTVTDATGTRTYGYDATSPWRLNTETLPAVFYQGNVFTRLYETTTSSTTGTVKGRSNGFQLGAAANSASLLQQSYTVNALGRIDSLTSARNSGAATQTFAYGYLAGSRLLETVAANGTSYTTTRSYETQRDLLTNIKAQWSTVTRSQFAYTLDTLGRRDTVAQDGDAYADYGNTVRQHYYYDDRGALKTANGYLGTEAPANKLPGRQFEYGYDAAGNRTSANHTGDPAKVDTFTPNGLNQLATRDNKTMSLAGTAAADATVIADNQTVTRKGRFWQLDLTTASGAGSVARALTTVAVKPGAGTGGADLAQIDTRYAWLPSYNETLTYDLDGNLKSDARWNYTWDAENRLVAMEANAWTAIPGTPRQRLEFGYDAAGRRVFKRVLNEAPPPVNWALVTENHYLYDGWNLLAEFAVSGSSLTLTRSYTWGLDLTGSLTGAGGVGGLLQITEQATGVSYFPTYDGNGNVATLVRASDGVTAASYDYSPFGETLRTVGSYAKSNPFRFSTKFTDDESGLIYYGKRYYDAHNGRFINRDPIEERGGMNLYGFCGNDGVNQWDYLGNSFFSSIGKFFKKYWKAIVVIALSVVTAGMAAALLAPALGITSAMGVGALAGGVGGFVAGAAGSALNGGSIGDMLKSGLMGGVLGAVSGGILGKLGTFQGFSKQMSFGTYLTKLGQATSVGAVASGIGSELNGGTFRDGFRTGAEWSAGGFVVTAGLETYLTEKGEVVYPDGRPRDPSQYRDITTNGINGNLGGFKMLVNNHPSTMGYYNPSQGIINDLMQSAFQKILFGWGDSLAKGFGDTISKMMPGPITITAHSQGTLTVTNAVFRGSVPTGSVLNLRSPAISYPRAWLAGQVNSSPMHYIQPWGDMANLWSPSLNPVKFASGVVDVFDMAGIHSGNYK